MGYQGPMFDGNLGMPHLTLTASVSILRYMDGKVVIEGGVPVHPELRGLAEECKRGF